MGKEMAMALWATRRAGALGILAAAGLGLIGCGGSGPAKTDPAKAVEVQPDASKTDGKTEASATEPAAEQHTKSAPPIDDPLYHSFADAVRAADNPPSFSNMPADATSTGKPTFKLLSSVQRYWDEIRFTTPDGKRIDYTAVLQTDFGPVEISLRPDAAPNHVRSFVALIQAGYYDGMRFDRIHHEVSPDQPNDPLDYLEAGCPLDKGDPEDGSIGYWLRAEGGPSLTHEIGSVGASHGRERDSAACKFYITLVNAPYLDHDYTVFGKVTRGLDVVRTMFTKPVVIEDQDPPGHNRPKDPIFIRKATIRTVIVAAPEGK
jgi:cyclophilin family peptidyl-prolyl cis-trans isomerase